MAGVISRGIQGPIIREGDDIVDLVVQSVYAQEKAEGWTLQDKDVIAVTESVVARAQGNYATVDQVAQDFQSLKKRCARFSEERIRSIKPPMRLLQAVLRVFAPLM